MARRGIDQRPLASPGTYELRLLRWVPRDEQIVLVFDFHGLNLREVTRTYVGWFDPQLKADLSKMTGCSIDGAVTKSVVSEFRETRFIGRIGPARRPGYVNLVEVLGAPKPHIDNISPSNDRRTDWEIRKPGIS